MANSPALRIVLADQLTRSVAALKDIDPARDIVLLAEVMEEATYVRHHKQKIAFLFSAMRHFASELEAEGITVAYTRLDDPANTGTLRGEMVRAVRAHEAGRIVATFPGEWRVAEDMRGWGEAAGVPLELREDDRFLCSRAQFAEWAGERHSLTMEYFYRAMRRRTGLLMTPDREPERGRWNFDTENRKSLPALLPAPAYKGFAPDAITEDVLQLVETRFGDHFGRLRPFDYGVTAAQAREALAEFVAVSLPEFGDYQDAMRRGDPVLFHARISAYLNAGLLDPLEVCRAAESAYHRGEAPLNAVEGFVRQVLGWREYVRGIYWMRMPDYATSNHLNATAKLPALYWTGETDMACMADVVAMTSDHAYAHHIQRLMVAGNFALLAGCDPAEVNEWYLVVYADAYEWVEMPNVTGMALYADGGVMGTKPYAASGAYINRMSDYCGGCRYDVRKKAGPDACPFNYLYWNFLIRNRAKLAGNPRLTVVYKSLDRMSRERLDEIERDSERFLKSLPTEY